MLKVKISGKTAKIDAFVLKTKQKLDYYLMKPIKQSDRSQKRIEFVRDMGIILIKNHQLLKRNKEKTFR